MTLAIFLITILVGVAGPLCIKLLLIRGFPYSDLVFWRSVIAILLVLPISLRRPAELRPLISAVSGLRFMIGGTILSLSVFAYSSLSATEVNLLARLDLPIFLVMFGTGSKRRASMGIVLLGLLYSLIPASQGLSTGLLAIWIATALTAFSYWLIRKAASTKSLAALVLPPYFGAIAVSSLLTGTVPKFPSLSVLPLLAGSAAAAVALYILCAELFKRARFGAAELTGCIALLCTYFTEGPLIGQAPGKIVGIAAAISVVLGLILVYWEEFPKWKIKKALLQ